MLCCAVIGRFKHELESRVKYRRLIEIFAGLIMMAASNNIATYAAAQVFYWVGENGLAYVLDVFIADTSSLKWRGLMFAFSTSPYIATTFAGPAAASAYLNPNVGNWRWVFGTWTIVTPVVCMPFLWVFWRNQRLARKQGILLDRHQASGRTPLQSLAFYLIEFDGELLPMPKCLLKMMG